MWEKKHLLEALLNYRNTPQQGLDKSPALRSMGRRTRGILPIAGPLLIPEGTDAAYISKAIETKRAQSKDYYDRKVGNTLPEVEKGDYVYLKPSPHNKGKPWLYGIVSDKPPLFFLLNILFD